MASHHPPTTEEEEEEVHLPNTQLSELGLADGPPINNFNESRTDRGCYDRFLRIPILIGFICLFVDAFFWNSTGATFIREHVLDTLSSSSSVSSSSSTTTATTTTPTTTTMETKKNGGVETTLQQPPSSLSELDTILWEMNHGNQTAGQVVLDMAIVGHAKCGTSTMMHWLGNHSELSIWQHEVYKLNSKGPEALVKFLYEHLPQQQEQQQVMKRGYKSPDEISNRNVCNLYRNYFPLTKLIVGIRHPVKWFESLYNFRVQNGAIFPPSTTFTFNCQRSQKGVCTERAKYHYHLVNLGKTNCSMEERLSSFPRNDDDDDDHNNNKTNRSSNGGGHDRGGHNGHGNYPRWSDILYTPNPIFLYDVEQLGDTNQTRTQQFRTDLGNYLGLQHPLEPIWHITPGKVVDATEQALRDSRKIDICHDIEWEETKQELISIGREVSHWLRTYFLPRNNNHHPEVVVSNLEHMEEILETYTRDPCASLPSP